MAALQLSTATVGLTYTYVSEVLAGSGACREGYEELLNEQNCIV